MKGIGRALLFLAALLAGQESSSQETGVCGNQLDLGPHECIRADDPEASCAAVLANEPQRLTATLALCDLAVSQGDYDRAETLLDQARAAHRADNYALNLIRFARSNVAEARVADAARPGDVEVLAQYLRIRCDSLNNLDACAELAGLRPDEVMPLNQLGKAALADGEIIWAIRRFEQSLSLDPSQSEITKELAVARAARLGMLRTCFNTEGGRSLDACVAARLTGADDEADLMLRIGDLHIGLGNYDEAKDYYERLIQLGEDKIAGSRIALVNHFDGCVSDKALTACELTSSEMPRGPSFSLMRAQTSVELCRLKLEMAPLIEAKTPCELALRENPTFRVGTRLGAKTLDECEALYKSGDSSSALIACELAKNLFQNSEQISDVNHILDQIRARRSTTDSKKSLESDSIVQAPSELHSSQPDALLTRVSNEPLRVDVGIAVITY